MIETLLPKAVRQPYINIEFFLIALYRMIDTINVEWVSFRKLTLP